MGNNEVFAPIPHTASRALLKGKADYVSGIIDYLKLFAVPKSGQLLYVNRSFADLLGYDREELLRTGSLDRVVATASSTLAQRLSTGGIEDTCEICFVRSDQTLFPTQKTTRNIPGHIPLGIIRDISQQRCQQAVNRLQHAGLTHDTLADLGKVVRMMADELQDTGIPFEMAELHMIDEEAQVFTSWTAYPESKGYQLFSNTDELSELLESHLPIRGLLNHWRRSKV